MLVVTAVDQSGNLASFSNYGPTTVDIAAPGVSILSTYPTKLGGHAVLSGTSMATPFVAGVVSLLVGLHPNWTAEQLVQQVIATAKPLRRPGRQGRQRWHGRRGPGRRCRRLRPRRRPLHRPARRPE